MDIFDFISRDQLSELPDDPRAAFAALVRIAQSNLLVYSGLLPDSTKDEDVQRLRYIRHSYANVIIAAGRKYGIDAFNNMDVPKLRNFDAESYSQFAADINFYLTQLEIDLSVRTRRDTALLDGKSKDRIRAHLAGLRDIIENADIEQYRRDDLLSKVRDFEQALDKKRLNLVFVAKLAMGVLAAPLTLEGNYDLVVRIITNIHEEVGKAKAEEEQRSLPPPASTLAIAPPRRALPAPEE